MEIWSMCSLLKLSGHSFFVLRVVFSPNGEYLASGSGDNTIGVWKVSSGEQIKTLSGHSSWVYSIVFSPDGEYLASGSSDNTIGCRGYQVENESKPSMATHLLSEA